MTPAGDLPQAPAQFLRRCPPFDRLAADVFAEVERALEVVYVPAATLLLLRGGTPNEHLFVVRKGSVRLERDGRLVDLLEEGEPFGFVSLLGGGAPEFDVVAAEDCLLLRLPGALFRQLLREPAVGDFFLSGVADRLRHAARLNAAPGLGTDLALPLRRLVTRKPISVGAEATVGEAARHMRECRVSSVLVAGEPMGILTDRDLRARVLAEGRGPETPVAAVMSAPVKTLAAEAPLVEGLLFMLEQNVHHVPLAGGDGAIVGVLTDTDLLRHQAKSPLYMVKALRREHDVAAGFADEVRAMVENLAWSGLGPLRIGRVVSVLDDAVVRRLLRDAEGRLGPPPCPYTWLALGSEGRRERLLPTDQDNALVHADGSPEAARYFEALATAVVDGLVAAGYPPCPGGYMATRWRDTVEGWEARIASWAATPRPQAVLELSTVADFRPVTGGLALERLDAAMVAAGADRSLLRAMAHGALTLAPPLGLFRALREDERGLDLKRGGILAIVTLARLFAFEAGSRALSTLDRLAAAVHAGVISPTDREGLAEGFRFLLRLRLKHQLDAVRRSGQAGNQVRVDALLPAERRALRETFALVRNVQEAVAGRFATKMLG